MSVEEPVAQDVDKGCQPIPPTDHLALGIGPLMVGNGHFVNATTAFRHRHSDLRLKAEAVRAQADVLQDLGSEHLVASLHVGGIEVRDPCYTR
jgi:hypothetical protein